MLIKRMQTKRDCFKKHPQNPLQNVNPRFPKTFAPHFPAFSWPLYTSSLREARRKILFSPLQLPLLLRKRQLKSNYTHSYEATPAIMPKPVFVPLFNHALANLLTQKSLRTMYYCSRQPAISLRSSAETALYITVATAAMTSRLERTSVKLNTWKP